MDQEFVMYLARESLYTILLLSAPILGGSLIVGLLVSIFQATTQIQEQTLTFVPKILAVVVIIALFGPWMLNVLVNYTADLFINLYSYTFIR